MDPLDQFASELKTFRLGKVEDIIYSSSNPINDIIDFFSKEAKSRSSFTESGLLVHSFILRKNLIGGMPREVATVSIDNGELVGIGIHGNTDKLRAEFNNLKRLMKKLDEQPEFYLGMLGERKGYEYYGNLYSNYVFGFASNIQIQGDTVQTITINPFK
ncbi:hypothetical protein [Lishizhenia tianjinensis]|nr:hypothetical protein [Lishizhenia tianjinensis]